MATRKEKKKRVSWELIGIMAVLAIVLVGGIVLVTTNPGPGALETPAVIARDPALKLDAPGMSGLDKDGRPYLGKADAPATFYEFADFQCPHCREFALNISKDIKKSMVESGKAKLVWVGFPFMDDSAGEDESVNAQMAAHCAAQQGKFWEMHDWLFANQNSVANTGGFNRQRLSDIALKVGLDAKTYAACMQDPATEAFVKTDRALGESKSVKSTPSFFVLGQDRLFEGTAPDQLQGLQKAIEAAGTKSS
jgi:protein-disulfide isomerase